MSTTDDEPEVVVERSGMAAGTRWNLVSLAAKNLGRIVFSVLLARMLGPENFGIAAQATIYLALVMVFLDFGVASTLIQRDRLDRRIVGTATVINLGIVALLIASTWALAGPVAAFFGTPELVAVLQVLSATLLFNGLAVVPSALLMRRMSFKLLGIAEVVGTFGGGLLGVAAALGGAGYWALVAQTLSRDLLFLAIVLVVTGPPTIAWSRGAAASIAVFGRNVFGTQLLRFVAENADYVLISWRFGATALANYSLSYRVLLLPVQTLGHTANRLMFPSLSRLNEEPDRQARYFEQATALLCLVVAPAMTLVALAAPGAVPIVFGPAWTGAVAAMQILAVGAIVRVVLSINPNALLARGLPHWVFRWTLVSVPLQVLGFAVGLRWGIEGVAWSYLAVNLPLGVVSHLMVSRVIPVSHRRYALGLAPALLGAGLMVVAWRLVEQAVSAVAVGGLTVLVLVAVVTYAATLYGVWRVSRRTPGWHARLEAQVDFVRRVAGRR